MPCSEMPECGVQAFDYMERAGNGTIVSRKYA
jgi:hypothetical protein